MIENIQNTFLAMGLSQQILWVVAVLSSAVFVIQAIGVFMGFDADSDIDLSTDVVEGGDADFDADGFHLISVKSIIAFLLGFSWTGVLFFDQLSPSVLGAVSFVVGLLFMSSVAFLLFQIKKLDRDNTFHIEQIVGLTADVYLRIPAGRADTGKITVSLNGSIHELEALSDTEIPTGAKVKILETVNDHVVLVKM